jgi:hypothetical protein
VFGESLPVSTRYQPDGTAAAIRIVESQLPNQVLTAVPVGRWPTGAGKLPALPVFQTRRNRYFFKSSK